MKKHLVILGASLVTAVCSGCMAAAAGAGAEAAYLGTQEERTVGETLDDQRITSSVKTRMLADPAVSGLDINVDTFRRHVTLRGDVDSGVEASRAIEIARGTSGVRSVQSQLFVR